jgi:TrmH family RNA methyltransferase
VSIIASRDNPRVRRWRALIRNAHERRSQQRAILEGRNLILAFLQSGKTVESLMLGKSAAAKPEFVALAKRTGKSPTVLTDAVFNSVVDIKAPAGIAAEISIPATRYELKTAQSCVLLDAIQDTGNVGTILRSAAAFGIRHAVLGKGCADAWSPKVLRAAAGAHFSLQIAENADLAEAISAFGGRIACTVPRGGIAITDADLSGRLGWLFGSEGRGVSDALTGRATLRISIPMSANTESLNVAATAAICFYLTGR